MSTGVHSSVTSVRSRPAALRANLEGGLVLLTTCLDCGTPSRGSRCGGSRRACGPGWTGVGGNVARRPRAHRRGSGGPNAWAVVGWSRTMLPRQW